MKQEIDTGNPEMWVQLLIDLYFSARRKKLHLPWMELVEDYLRDSVDDRFVARSSRHSSDLARDRKTAADGSSPDGDFRQP